MHTGSKLSFLWAEALYGVAFLASYAYAQSPLLLNYALGVRSEALGKHTEAMEAYQKAMQGAPDSFYLRQKVSSGYLLQGKTEKANESLSGYIRQSPNHYDAQVYYADFLRGHVSLDAASKHLEGLLRLFPGDIDVVTRSISVFETIGRRDASESLLKDELARADAPYPHWLALLPIVRMIYPGGSEELSAAEELLCRRLESTALADANVARRLMQYHQSKGALLEAVSILQKNLELSPTSLELRTRLGQLYLAAGEEQKALETLKQSLRIAPDQVLTHQTLAEYYSRKGEVGKGLVHRAQVLGLRGGSRREFLELAADLQRVGDNHTVRRLLEPLSYEHPEDPRITARLTVAAWKEAAYAQAKKFCQLTEQLQEQEGETRNPTALGSDYYYTKGHIQMSSGDYSAAERSLREAVKSAAENDPQQASMSLTALAKLWLDTGKNTAAAKTLLHRALDMNPQNQKARELLGE